MLPKEEIDRLLDVTRYGPIATIIDNYCKQADIPVARTLNATPL
jgi:hypothetical protein